MTARDDAVQRLAALLREDPVIRDGELVIGPGGEVTAVVVPQGFRTGPELRLHLRRRAALGTDADLRVLVVSAVPRQPGGELDEASVARLLASAGAIHRFDAPSGRLELQLRDLVREVSQLEEVSMSDSLGGLGVDSVAVAELQGLIEQRMGVAIELLDVYSAPSLRHLAERIAESEGGRGAP